MSRAMRQSHYHHGGVGTYDGLNSHQVTQVYSALFAIGM